VAPAKYGHMIKKLKFEKGKSGPKGTASPDYRTSMGGKDLEGMKLLFGWGYLSQAGVWGPPQAHTDPADEALLFVGLDPERPDYLGAEVEIAMGKEQEIHVFDYPAVVVVPAGFVHCPLVTRRVDKPYAFSAISLNTEHQTTWLGTGKSPWEQ
jgi:hypothetical protein